jgi:F-type H+/Na+-transporting ATPase subunit alpha
MSINRIIEELEASVKNIDLSPEVKERGVVISLQDSIARASGLSSAMSSEMVYLGKDKVEGLILNLEEDAVGIVVFDSMAKISEGDEVLRSGQLLSINVSESMLGRVVSPLGLALDGGSQIAKGKSYPIERIAPGVMEREPVNVPMQTGIKAIDGMIPVGRGQRELIIGDRQTGKTTIALDTIINQKGSGVICIYVAIAQKESRVAQVVETLKEKGAMDYTCVVLAGVSEGPALSYLAPYTGTAIAEYFMDMGKDVLVIYDDLSKHAVSYRELSLLLKRSPGREAYPGDVFYLHSRLLERSCRRNAESGGGSITSLPIIETQAGDISAYVPTNVISITDGQIFLDSNIFYKGIRPAVDVGLSVSRVGGSAQTSAIKKNASKIKLSLAQYRELESFSQFDSDLDADTKATIEHGKRSVELLKQKDGQPLSVAEQTVSFFALNDGFFKNFEVKEVLGLEKDLHKFVSTNNKELFDTINRGKWSDEISASLKSELANFLNSR